MGFDQVQMAIQVVIANSNTHATQLLSIAAQRDTANQSLLAERSVAVVHEQETWSGVAGNKDVWPAVFVGIKCDGR